MKPAKTIVTNGKTLPFSFGMAALSRFCEQEGITLQGLNELGANLTPLKALRLIEAGLKDGHRREGKEYTLTIDDIGDLIDDDPNFMANCMELVNGSMPDSGNGKAGSRTKAPRI